MIILLVFTEYFEDIKKKEDYSFKNEAFVTLSFFFTLVAIKIRMETIPQKISQVIFIP